MIFLGSDRYNFIIGYIFFYSFETSNSRLPFSTPLAPKLFRRSSTKARKRDRDGRKNDWEQLLTVTPFFFIFALSNLIPDSCYPILILVHRSNRGYRSTQLFGSSEATVFCLPSNTPTAFHRNILIAINNCRRDKTTLARIYPLPRPWKNFRINYRGIIARVWNFGIGSNKWANRRRQKYGIFDITHWLISSLFTDIALSRLRKILSFRTRIFRSIE